MSITSASNGDWRIAKNAVMLSVRMFFTLIVGLYAFHAVLAALGVENFGVYGVVSCIVTMIGFLNRSEMAVKVA